MLDFVLFIGKHIDRRKANAAKKANYDSDQLRIVMFFVIISPQFNNVDATKSQ